MEKGERVAVCPAIRNVHRTAGTLLSYEITEKYGAAGLPEDTVVVNAVGSAGAELPRVRRAGQWFS